MLYTYCLALSCFIIAKHPGSISHGWSSGCSFLVPMALWMKSFLDHVNRWCCFIVRPHCSTTYIQGCHTSWKILESSGFFPKLSRPWNVLENEFGPENYSLRSSKVLKFTCDANYTIGIVPSLGSWLVKHSGREY